MSFQNLPYPAYDDYAICPIISVYSFVLAQAVAVCYALAVGFVVFRRSKSWRGGDRFEDGRGDASGSDIREGDGNVGRPAGIAGFPVWRLAMMAILDMLHLVPMIVAAADVAPTLTVLLLQCSAPFCLAVAALFCRRCVRIFKNAKCSVA